MTSPDDTEPKLLENQTIPSGVDPNDDAPTPRLFVETKAIRPFADFLRTESSGGLIIVICIIVALVWANSPWGDTYDQFWESSFSLGLGGSLFSLDLRHWVNDGLMAIFFFVLGLELKREFTQGELRDRRKIALPLLGALGGMIAPSVLFLALTLGTGAEKGWGIPMATDTGIALGVLALLGTCSNPRMKALLLTLAIVDDLAAIVLLATVYTAGSIKVGYLGLALGMLVIMWCVRRQRIISPILYLALSIAIWAAVFASGVHTTLAGVALALITPVRPVYRPEYIDAEELADIADYSATKGTIHLAKGSISSLEWLQHRLHPWSSYLIMPLFALANAGIHFTSDTFGELAFSAVSLGACVGLFIGKPAGVLIGSWVAKRFFVKDSDITYRDVVTAGFLAGIGFTMSVFIAKIAYGTSLFLDQAKVGIMAASLLASVAGFLYARNTSERDG